MTGGTAEPAANRVGSTVSVIASSPIIVRRPSAQPSTAAHPSNRTVTVSRSPTRLTPWSPMTSRAPSPSSDRYALPSTADSEDVGAAVNPAQSALRCGGTISSAEPSASTATS
nr:hypothetical protein GCM10020092_069600 [Actinoplanes digitatis]